MYDNRNRTHHHESCRPHVDVDCLQDKLLLSDLPGELPTDREHKVIVENVSLVILCHAHTVPVSDVVYYAQMRHIRHIQHTVVEEQCVSLFTSSLPDRQSVLAVYVNQHTHLTLRNVGEVRDATDMRLVPPSRSSSEPLLLKELTITSREESVYVDICHLRCDYMRVEVGEKSLVFCAQLEAKDALFMLYASAQAAIEVLQAKRVCVLTYGASVLYCAGKVGTLMASVRGKSSISHPFEIEHASLFVKPTCEVRRSRPVHLNGIPVFQIFSILII